MSPFHKMLHLDRAVVLYLRKWHAPSVTHVMKALTRLADPPVVTVMGISMIASGTRTGLKLGVRLGIATLLATALTQVLKRLLKRQRPDVRMSDFQALAKNPDAFSFPSGHTAAAFAVAWALAGNSTPATATCFTLASGVGFSRIYLGAHFPFDVVVGALIGSSAGMLSHWLMGG